MKDARAVSDMVALTEGLPERGPYKGQVGTAVESLSSGIFDGGFARHPIIGNDAESCATRPFCNPP